MISPMITRLRLKIFSARIWLKERLIFCLAFTAIMDLPELITRSGKSLRVIEPFSTDVSIISSFLSIIYCNIGFPS